MTIANIGFWEGIMDTAHGRGQLRLILQPIMAILFGVRLGISDAKEGYEPFLLRVFHSRGQRFDLVKQALISVIVPFSIAVVLDGILQYLTLGYVRPLAAVVVGIALIGVPFAVVRALSNRIYRRSHPHIQPST